MTTTDDLRNLRTLRLTRQEAMVLDRLIGNFPDAVEEVLGQEGAARLADKMTRLMRKWP